MIIRYNWLSHGVMSMYNWLSWGYEHVYLVIKGLSAGITGCHRVIFLSLSDHLRRIRTNQTGRSLTELTGDSDIFVYLHKYFVFLLKAGGQRVIECVVEGPPRVMAKAEPTQSPSQEAKPLNMEQCLDKPLSAIEFHMVKVEKQPYFQSLRHLFKVSWENNFLALF